MGHALSNRISKLSEAITVITEQVKQQLGLDRRHGKSAAPPQTATDRPPAIDTESTSTNEPSPSQMIVLSSLCLGFASAGAMFYTPLRLLCPPLLAYLGWRDLQLGYRALSQERRVNQALFDSAITTICIVQGYYTAGALKFCGQALVYAQLRTAQQQQEAKRQQLFQPRAVPAANGGPNRSPKPQAITGAEPTATHSTGCAMPQWHEHNCFIVKAGELLPWDGTVVAGRALVTLPWRKQTETIYTVQGASVQAATLVQIGQLYVESEHKSDAAAHDYLEQLLQHTMNAYVKQTTAQRQRDTEQMAFPLLSIATLATLMWGSAASVGVLGAWGGCDTTALTTLAAQHLLTKAAQQGILIQDLGVIAQLTKLEALVLDSTVVHQPEAPAVLLALKHDHAITTWLLRDEADQLSRRQSLRLGITDQYVAPDAQARASLLQELQTRHTLCFVTATLQETIVMDTAQVAIYLQTDHTPPCALPSGNTAQVILLDGTLEQLQMLFTLVHEFHTVTRNLARKRTILSALSMAAATLCSTGLGTTVLANYSSFWLGLHDSETWGASLPPTNNSTFQKGTETNEHDTHEP